MVTTVREWREQNAPEEVELPSGNLAMLRKVHITDLALSGAIPATLLAEAAKFSQGKDEPLAIMVQDSGDFQRWLGLINPVVIAAFVEPKVAKEPSEDALGVNEISGSDRLAVFRWCNEGASALEPFREDPIASLESAPAGQSIQPAAQ